MYLSYCQPSADVTVRNASQSAYHFKSTVFKFYFTIFLVSENCFNVALIFAILASLTSLYQVMPMLLECQIGVQNPQF